MRWTPRGRTRCRPAAADGDDTLALEGDVVARAAAATVTITAAINLLWGNSTSGTTDQSADEVPGEQEEEEDKGRRRDGFESRGRASILWSKVQLEVSGVDAGDFKRWTHSR